MHTRNLGLSVIFPNLLSLVFILFSLTILLSDRCAAAPGDIDNSQMISPKDAILGLLVATQQKTEDGIQLTADIDGDGRIGVGESIYALQISKSSYPGPLVVSNCDKLSTWNAGELSETEKIEGEASIRWNHATVSGIALQEFPADFSRHKTLSFYLHSNTANSQGFMLIISSENSATDGLDYYSREIIADFIGWKRFDLDLASFSISRSPLGWDNITGFMFTASGWGNEPNPDNIILIDNIGLSGEPPKPVDVLANLFKGHPRLMVPGGNWQEVKNRVDQHPFSSNALSTLIRNADKVITEPVSTYVLPDGIRLLATCRRVLGRIYNLAFAYRMTGDNKYLIRAYAELEAAAAFPDWNPPHFLDVAEMTHAFAIGYDWLYDAWSDEQRTVIRNAIIYKGLQSYLAGHDENAWWLFSEFNWNTVTNGGIGIGALAIADEEPQLAWNVINKTLVSLKNSGSLDMFGPDGAWPESPGYWSYATQYLFLYCASLQSGLRDTFGLLNFAGIPETGGFPVYMTGPTWKLFNYADGSENRIRAPWLFWLDEQFSNPLFSWLQEASSVSNALDIIWYQPNGASPMELGLPLDKYYRKVEVATFRTSWEDENSLFAGFKAGHNDVGHSHLDLGEFMFDALGERWIHDMGSGDYNASGYFSQSGDFSALRWTYYRCRAEANNTLVINPDNLADQDPEAITELIKFETNNAAEGFAIADLTDAYDEKGAQRVLRGLALINNKTQLLLQDEITMDQPSEIWWFANIYDSTDVILTDNGKRAVLTQNGKKLDIRILPPAQGAFEVKDGKPLPTSPNPYGQEFAGKKLAIHLTGVATTTLPILFTPIAIDGMDITIPEILSLENANWP